MLVKEIIHVIERIAPLSYQESYDNSGLLVGNKENKVSGALLCLDITEAVLDEAIALKYNLIISHHPVIFGGLKRLTGTNFVQRVVEKAIRNNLNLYAAHTNLDNVLNNGVNQKIAEKLELTGTKVLQPLQNNLYKLVTYCPSAHSEQVKQSLWDAGAGNIGNYDQCSFTVQGKGSFRPGNDTNPFLGTQGELEIVEEDKIEVIFERHKRQIVLNALHNHHPYEEVAYEITEIINADQTKGAGIIGSLKEALTPQKFLDFLKTQMNLQVIKYTSTNSDFISRVAICGGSGRFLLSHAMSQQADAFVTADFKYHDYFDADNQLMVCDIGHYESEIFTLEIFIKILTENFPTFAARLTKISTNPVNYYY